jgi:glutamate-5-semialdehyde dehydrogenase (EC 1.2.1.41)
MTTDAKVDAAAEAALGLATTSTETRDEALEAMATAIEEAGEEILAANAVDVEQAERQLAAGAYTQALVDRLKLTEAKLASIVEMVRSVAAQPDPIGQTVSARELAPGLELFEVRVPLGVVAAVFESRPDALVQIAALGAKSGNAVILKGGSEAAESNRTLHAVIAEATPMLPVGWSALIEAREDVETVLARDDAVDLVMPRGSGEFVAHVEASTRIPVLGHTEGVCHVFIDADADAGMAAAIAMDAKTQYPAVCNAMETLLVHEAVAADVLPPLVEELQQAGVTLRGDAQTRQVVELDPVTPDDWRTEYGDLELSIGTVGSLDAAVEHINTNGSKHTEAIVTEDAARARRFMQAVDAASVFHNASTRFADGYRYGLGAEVGIATGKTHARGPVGVEGLTTTKYYLEGEGHRVAEFTGADATAFTHRRTPDAEW